MNTVRIKPNETTAERSADAISYDLHKLGADWLSEQREYVVRQLESVLRGNPTLDEKRIASEMLSFYRGLGSVGSAYLYEDPSSEILPGFIPVREAIDSNSSHAERSN